MTAWKWGISDVYDPTEAKRCLKCILPADACYRDRRCPYSRAVEQMAAYIARRDVGRAVREVLK